MRLRYVGRPRGQALVELALAFPLFVMLFFGLITLGIGVFYQQQLTNAAREAARFASIHSATASQPTVSWLDPHSKPLSYLRYDRPEDGWPYMTDAARRLIFGLNASDTNIAACWSGYQELDPATGAPDPNKYDAPPPVDAPGYELTPGASPPVYWDPDTTYVQCTIDGADPTTDPEAIGCSSSLATTTVDTASDMSEGPGSIVANVVTAYACYDWSPPLAGFLLIPDTITLRAVISESIERQQ
jgi:TadE-like protein